MKTQTLNDELLIKACFGGNTEAFGRLVHKYQSFVCAVTFSAVGSRDKSEELAQDIFVLAWQNLSKLKEPAKFKNWLYTIAKNRIRSFYRHQKRDPVSHAVALDYAGPVRDTASSPPESVISQEQQDFVRAALSRIPDSYREPLVLFYREGKSVKQVAECFELSEAAAKKRLSRARQMIKSNLSAMLEQTLVETQPKETFSVAVLALIAGSGTLSKTTAAAATVHSGKNLFVGFLHSLAAKIAATATAVIIGVSAITYVAIQADKAPAESVVRLLPLELDEGLVLYLSFDVIEENNGETIITDGSLKGNHGILTGGKFVTGRLGTALRCRTKNKSDGVVVKDNDSLDLDVVTIAAWIKTDQIDGKWGRILDKGWQTAYNLCIGGIDKKGQDWYRDRGQLECAGKPITSKAPVVDGKWHFIAGTYDGWTLQLYIDGKLDIERKLKQPQTLNKPRWNEAAALKHNDTDIHIGSLAVWEPAPYNEAFFDGLIDEVRLYNRVLSEKEIDTLYHYQPYYE